MCVSQRTVVLQCSGGAAGPAGWHNVPGGPGLIAGWGCGTRIAGELKTRGSENVGIDLSGGHPEMDYAEHERTYSRFLTFAKIGIGFLVVLMVGMYVFLV
jgi:Bacterial aa3 type cytochrome c oxidase subunit IV